MKFPGECPSEVDSFEVSSQVSNCSISREFTTEAMVQQHSVDFLSHSGHTVLNGERSAVSVNSGADLQGVSCRTGGSGVALMRRDELCEEFASQCFSVLFRCGRGVLICRLVQVRRRSDRAAGSGNRLPGKAC